MDDKKIAIVLCFTDLFFTGCGKKLRMHWWENGRLLKMKEKF